MRVKISSHRHQAHTAMLLIVAFLLTSLPGLDLCGTALVHGPEEITVEAHCPCVHGAEQPGFPFSLASSGMSDCGAGCACIPARNNWQSQLPGRVQSEQRARQLPDFTGLADTSNRFLRPDRFPFVDLRAMPAAPPADPVLLSLRTIVLLA